SLNGVLLTQADYGTGDRAINWKTTPYAYPLAPGNPGILSAAQTYQSILSKVGASYPHRDQVDQFMINELTSLGTQGITISTFTNENLLPAGGPGNVSGGTAPTDTDRDGMPDQWEQANNLNPTNAADGKTIRSDGYTNLEHYINSIVSSVVLKTIVPRQHGKASLKLFPNPAKDHGILHCILPDGGPYRIEVFNAGGQPIKIITDSKAPAGALLTHKLDLTGLPSGTYTVRMISAGETISRKLVIQQ
ncbi:MAG TPA: T9SS type A sorting domain-containing protein, partial [Chitinophaga sp.]|nr:T9SS type A sorting domain-containing protein [Chitinophaga sp.]